MAETFSRWSHQTNGKAAPTPPAAPATSARNFHTQAKQHGNGRPRHMRPTPCENSSRVLVFTSRSSCSCNYMSPGHRKITSEKPKRSRLPAEPHVSRAPPLGPTPLTRRPQRNGRASTRPRQSRGPREFTCWLTDRSAPPSYRHPCFAPMSQV